MIVCIDWNLLATHARALKMMVMAACLIACVINFFLIDIVLRTAEPLGEHRYENWNTHTQK